MVLSLASHHSFQQPSIGHEAVPNSSTGSVNATK
jgi:hypothetical protein